jgi:hypothetical protein
MKAAGAFMGLPRGLERSLSSNILHALIELLGAGIEAVLSAGKHLPVGVCIFKIIRRLGGAARQKQCQADNGNVSFLASPKSCQNKVSRVSYAHATTCGRYIARTGTEQLCKRYFQDCAGNSSCSGSAVVRAGRSIAWPFLLMRTHSLK